jgi:FdhE protein
MAALRERSSLLINETETDVLCPFCGYYPDMAAIVSGKDGKRFLHCSLCGHRWPFRRIMCAVCGTEDADKLENLTPEGDTRNRIDVCRSCNGYIKTLRFDSIDALDECDLSVENIFTAGLDSAALKKGFSRP